jgi:hypothetical protein
MDGDVVRGLRSRGIDVVTAADAGMIRRQDEDHLRLATVQSRALYSFNVGDFHEIHRMDSQRPQPLRHRFDATAALLGRRTDSAVAASDRLRIG